MAKQSTDITETDADEGSSATKVFRTTWDARRTDPDIPHIGAPYGPDSPELLIARRIVRKKIPAQGGALCDITVEYATPQMGGQAVSAEGEEEDEEDPTYAPTADEVRSTSSEIMRVFGGFSTDAGELLIEQQVDMLVSYADYQVTKLYRLDHSEHFDGYAHTVNSADVANIGRLMTFGGKAEHILLDEVEISPIYTKVEDDFELRYSTRLKFRRRNPASWNHVWIEPTPMLDRNGKPYVYVSTTGGNGDKPFQSNATHPRGSTVYLQSTLDGDGNLRFDWTKIGWQKASKKGTNPLSNSAYTGGGIYTPKSWTNLFPDDTGT